MSALSANDVVGASINKRPYFFLLRHSLSFSQRCDLQPRSLWLDSGKLWLEYVAKSVLSNPEPKVSEPFRHTGSSLLSPSVVFVATLPPTKNSTAQYFQATYDMKQMRLIQIDPVDWKYKADELSNHLPTNLERLDTIISAVQSFSNSSDLSINNPFVLMFDSISPILMRHGFEKTLLFLQELARSFSHAARCRLVVVPIRSEMFTAQQHRTLEDALLPDAILNASQMAPELIRHFSIDTSPEFHAMLLRRGVRESDRIHREEIPYRFCAVTDKVGHDAISYRSCRYEIDFLVERERVATIGDDIIPNTSFDVIRELGCRGKSNFKLDLHDGRRMSASAEPLQTQRHPNIFMQENDPEFEDYDDEEPDDDLEL
jgi:hypothetical protein